MYIKKSLGSNSQKNAQLFLFSMLSTINCLITTLNVNMIMVFAPLDNLPLLQCSSYTDMKGLLLTAAKENLSPENSAGNVDESSSFN